MNQRGGELESRGYTVSNTIQLCIEAEKQLFNTGIKTAEEDGDRDGEK